jgi:hypothetical protein
MTESLSDERRALLGEQGEQPHDRSREENASVAEWLLPWTPSSCSPPMSAWAPRRAARRTPDGEVVQAADLVQ